MDGSRSKRPRYTGAATATARTRATLLAALLRRQRHRRHDHAGAHLRSRRAPAGSRRRCGPSITRSPTCLRRISSSTAPRSSRVAAQLPYPDQGAMALIVFPDGKTRLTTLPESKADDNLNSSEYSAQLSKEGQLAINGKERFFGARASALAPGDGGSGAAQDAAGAPAHQVFNGVHIGELEFSDNVQPGGAGGVQVRRGDRALRRGGEREVHHSAHALPASGGDGVRTAGNAQV